LPALFGWLVLMAAVGACAPGGSLESGAEVAAPAMPTVVRATPDGTASSGAGSAAGDVGAGGESSEGADAGIDEAARDRSREPEAAFAPEEVSLSLVAVAADFERPIAGAAVADGSGRVLVAEKAGRLWWVDPATDSTASAASVAGAARGLVIDLRDRVNDGASEQGLLGVAPHPDFAANGRLFLSYSAADDATVIVELAADVAGMTADPTSEREVLRIAQPARNHNGGHIAFGPDGYLWIGTGDGGRAGDPWNNAQDPTVLLGKMLRIDVDGALPYAIPADNPYAAEPGLRPEIWATGLRNPWRYHFDRATGDLFIGDVGQNVWEEIDREPADDPGGRNYGWRLKEAEVCFEPERGCDPQGDTMAPILAYAHGGGNGCSVTGGTVYRGLEQPVLWGLYVYADYCSGRIWAATPGAEPASPWREAVVFDSGRAIASFVEDEQGELFVLDDAGGELLRVKGIAR
jgi:glucose/arabinose dehydrogenase